MCNSPWKVTQARSALSSAHSAKGEQWGLRKGILLICLVVHGFRMYTFLLQTSERG
jgi:hypothetical protein